jgi:hypothetical protein
MRSQYNATIGYGSEIMLLLGNVGWYCGAIINGAHRNVALEACFEHHLLQPEFISLDDHSHLANNVFRRHGLIVLYRSIQSAPTLVLFGFPSDGFHGQYPDHSDIKQHTKDIRYP